MKTLPTSPLDLHSDALLEDPYPAYRTLRDLGSAVYLAPTQVVFIGRFADVRAGLADWQTFTSQRGIGLNPVINAAWKEALICQDPPVHTERRKLMDEVLGAVALRPVQESVTQRAADLADRVAQLGEFDAVTQLAHDLPVNLVMDLIGWPHDVRPGLLKLADSAWNAAGPEGPRMSSALGQLQQMMGLIAEIYDHDRILPGSFAARLVESARRGEITRDTAIGMLAGYIVAAFETTISAMAAGVYLFATNPAEWQKLRANPKLATQAADEIVRWESPLQAFARVTARDAEMSDGSVIPQGQRVMLSYASANRDERYLDEPDAFRIDRRPRQHMGFGNGPHGCAGQTLARMELVAVFTALAHRLERIELTGTPQRNLNNVSRAFAHLPVRAVPTSLS